MCNNQENKEMITSVFKIVRKRIETLFAQFSEQFMLIGNYAKYVAGLSIRILNKIFVVTSLQFINKQNNKLINHLNILWLFNRTTREVNKFHFPG